MVFQIKIKNLLKEKKEFRLFTKLKTILRTCQSYTVKDRGRVTHTRSGSVTLIDFDEADTDSAQVFVANVGELPIASKGQLAPKNLRKEPEAVFEYMKKLQPDEELVVIQLIESCRQTESKEVLERSLKGWKQSVKKYEQRISRYARDQATFRIHDAPRWSKPLVGARQYYQLIYIT